MELKLFTRELGGKVEPEVYFIPQRYRQDGQPVVIGKIDNIETLPDGRRLVTITIDDRNKKRFDDVKEGDWVESYFTVWHKRRLLLPQKKQVGA